MIRKIISRRMLSTGANNPLLDLLTSSKPYTKALEFASNQSYEAALK